MKDEEVKRIKEVANFWLDSGAIKPFTVSGKKYLHMIKLSKGETNGRRFSTDRKR